MKIYNIENSRTFFNNIRSCAGTVKIRALDRDYPLVIDGKETPYLSLLADTTDSFSELELLFDDPKDFAYALNKFYSLSA